MQTDINQRSVYIETYGCQMNLNDTEIVQSILSDSGYSMTDKADQADVILLNTCSVRDNAEQTIYNRLTHMKHYKKSNNKLVVGILGCMAERLRSKLINEKQLVSIVVGPDEYRSLPSLINSAFEGSKGIAVKLSKVETYDDITPLRSDGVSAWLSIMRGCNNFCSYCVVPYTRGRERSRQMNSIIREIENLSKGNIREVTLLGQNVNSYKCPESGSDFPDLLESVAVAAPSLRIRYMTSHPIDMSDKLIETMALHDNICRHIHLPVQSGSDRILQAMDRKYTIEHYLGRIEKIRKEMPDCALSTDIIAGYPGETEADHSATLDIINQVQYDGAFMFKYSPREGTKAFKLEDDVPEVLKIERLNEIIALQNKIAKEKNELEKGRIHEVLAEGPSKKNKLEWQGRTGTNKITIFPNHLGTIQAGDLVKVKIIRSTSATLFGEIVEKNK